MKKSFLFALLVSTPLWALPIGNPMDPALNQNGIFWNDCYQDSLDPRFGWLNVLSIRLGFYGDYVFERNLEINKQGKKDIDIFKIDTNAAYIILNICDRADIFTTLGASEIELRANPQIFGTIINNSLLFLQTDSNFSWSIGGRLAIWNCECLYFGLEGQYFYTKPSVDIIEAGGSLLAYPDNDVRLKYEEWQVGIGASYLVQIGCSGVTAVPYIGIKWSGVCANFDDATIPGPSTELSPTLFGLTNNKLWGYGLGITFVFCDMLSATVEGRFGDERAVHVNGQIRF